MPISLNVDSIESQPCRERKHNQLRGDMTPAKQIMDKLAETVSDSAKYGMTFEGTAPAVLQLGLQLTVRALGPEATIIVLRRIADELAGPTPPDFAKLFSLKPKGTA
jgi:hypothetical protein